MGRRKPPTKIAELPNAFFLDDTAFAEHVEIATAYEKAVADYERHGDECVLWEILPGLGYEPAEIQWLMAHRGERMGCGYIGRRGGTK